eukprot:11219033-Lingulodinium_polyedra.AAC.1
MKASGAPRWRSHACSPAQSWGCLHVEAMSKFCRGACANRARLCAGEGYPWHAFAFHPVAAAA